jgi:hypothetical protein
LTSADRASESGPPETKVIALAAAIRRSSPIRPDGRWFPFDGPSEEERHAQDPAVVGKLVYGCLLPIWPTAPGTSSTSCHAMPRHVRPLRCALPCRDHASCDGKRWQSPLGLEIGLIHSGAQRRNCRTAIASRLRVMHSLHRRSRAACSAD